MSERLILAIFLAICVGQVAAVMRGRLAAVTYYLSVAPISYFTVWAGGSWDAERLCGLILLVGMAIRARRTPEEGLHPRMGPYLALLIYGVLVTALLQSIWPVAAMSSNSAVYGSLRAAVQISNWLIMGGVGWHIAKAFSAPGALRKARKGLMVAAFLLCAYGVYQYVAEKVGLPATGIRRSVKLAMGESMVEEYGAYTLAGTVVFRPGSLAGEPKSLGGACVFWLALIVSAYFEDLRRTRMTVMLVLVLVTLWLTASTSAWAGGLICLGLFALVISRQGAKAGWHAAKLPVLILVGLGIATLFLDWKVTAATLQEIFEIRVANRVVDPVSDLPEICAKEVLKDHPSYAVTGTGLGGMSFYIAQYLGGGLPMILFPNNGLLGIICNVGVIGLALMLWIGKSGFAELLKPRGGSGVEARALALVGVTLFAQCMIFGGQWMLGAAFGFLIAADAHQTYARGGVRLTRATRPVILPSFLNQM